MMNAIYTVDIQHYARLLKNNRRRTVEVKTVRFNAANLTGTAVVDSDADAIAVAEALSGIESRDIIKSAVIHVNKYESI